MTDGVKMKYLIILIFLSLTGCGVEERIVDLTKRSCELGYLSALSNHVPKPTISMIIQGFKECERVIDEFL